MGLLCHVEGPGAGTVPAGRVPGGVNTPAGADGDEHWLRLGPGMLGRGMERQLERARRKLVADGLAWGIWREPPTGALRPVIERLHTARDVAGRPFDLDDPGERAAWRARWPPAAVWLLAIGGRLAGYCLAEPGRLLEAAVLGHYAAAGYRAVLWGAWHPEALIAASSC